MDFNCCSPHYVLYTDNRDKYLAMRIFEISDSADRERVERLVRTSQLASNALKQERYRQRMKNYRDKMADRKPGQKVPEMPKPPKPIKPDL